MSLWMRSLKDYKVDTLITKDNKKLISELAEIGVVSTRLNMETLQATAKINEGYECLLVDTSKRLKKRKAVDTFFESIGRKVI